jgi:hypothetical protein
MRIIRSLRGRAGTVIVAGVVSAIMSATVVVAGGGLLSKKAYKRNEGIFVAHKERVSPLPPSTAQAPVVQLPNLPKGNYLVVATGNAFSSGPTGGVFCYLQPPGPKQSEIDWSQTSGPFQLGLPLSAAVSLNARSTVSLVCGGDSISSLHRVTLSAIRSRSLKELPSP